MAAQDMDNANTGAGDRDDAVHLAPPMNRVRRAIAWLVLWALRARWGLAAVVITANLSGLAVIVTELWLSNFFDKLGENWFEVLALVAIYPTIGFLVGVALAIRDRNVYFGWFDQARKPTPEEARRLLRLPFAITLRALAIWIPGVIVAA